MSKRCAVGFEDILTRARTGDEGAWSELYDSLAPQVLGYLRARGARDAEEVLGDVFLHVARGIDGFDGTASGFRSWVFVIATSRLQDERRRLRRRPTEPLPPQTEERLPCGDDVEEEVEHLAAAAEVQQLLGALTADQRTVVELRVFGGLTSQEVADAVGKPLGAVKALYRRGLGALRRELDRAPAALDLPAPAATNVVPFPAGPVPLPAAAAVQRGS